MTSTVTVKPKARGLSTSLRLEREFHTAADGRLEVYAGVQCREDQHERADHFPGEGVGEVVVNIAGTVPKTPSLTFLSAVAFPVRQVVEVDQSGADHCAEYLGDDGRGPSPRRELAERCQADRLCGLEVAAGIGVGGVTPEGDGEAPTEGRW